MRICATERWMRVYVTERWIRIYATERWIRVYATERWMPVYGTERGEDATNKFISRIITCDDDQWTLQTYLIGAFAWNK